MRFRKVKEGKTLYRLQVLEMNDDFSDRVRGLGTKMTGNKVKCCIH